MAPGLAEGEHPLGRQAGGDGRAERARHVVGGVPVAGEDALDRRGGRVAHQLAALVDGLRQARVQRAALARQQVAVDGLADQRVAERVGLARAGHDHLVRDRLAQAAQQVGLVEVRQRRQQPVAHRVLDRDRAHDLLRGVGQPLHARDEQVAQRLGQLLAAVGGGGEQLLGVERVALAALEQAVGEVVGGRRVEDRGDLGGELVAAEALQPEPVDAGRALELGQQRPQRMAPVQLVGAVGDDQRQRLRARAAHEEGQEVARGLVGPVQVLEHQHDGLDAAEPLDQRQQRLEHARLVAAVAVLRGGVRRAELRHQLRERGARGGRQPVGDVGAALGQLAGDRAQRVDQRRVRDRGAAQLQAVADEHARAGVAGAGFELGDEPALADAGLAGDEGEGGNARRRAAERAVESGELVRAADERG